MMMVRDDCLVECKIDDSDEEQINTPPPPPEFASKASTPKPPTPPAEQAPPTPTCSVSRDPKGINKHLKVEVSDVLSEPTAPHSTAAVWTVSVCGFERTRVWTYRCLTLLLAVPMAFVCGLSVAVLASLRVWFLVPCIQLSSLFIPCLRSLCLCAVDVVVSPFCVSLALCCSQIIITLTRKDKPESKDTV
ncbi:caveolin-2-like [Oryzias latipes]|uniref:Caveolin n=1 Tax=Oryzias latipes TaxID=8090 RepID=A0A3B3HMM8_ORYLA|nr:caveolin-2-like [Oryzias latipes]XP_011475063.1 caveolin-2-like [Oryzias latipes]